MPYLVLECIQPVLEKMEMLQFFLALSLSVLLCQQPANGEGVSLVYNGAPVEDFDVKIHIDIGDGDKTLDDVLFCKTDNSFCCGDSDNSSEPEFGGWYYPSGDRVVFSKHLPEGQIYQQQEDTQAVRLQRVVGRDSITTAADGIYRCELADKNGIVQTRYIGLYTKTSVTVAAHPPSDLTAVQSGLNSVDVSWTAPAPGGATRTGYRIVFETDGSEESVDVEADATSHTLTDLELGETYNFSIVALSAILPSEVVGPEMVTIEGPMMPHVLTRVLNSTSIAVTFIQLSGPPAERYDIEYTRVNGAGQRLCPGVRDAGNKTDVPSPYIILADLEEFSNYTFAVTAHFFSSMVTMTTQQVEETMHAPPTGFPLNLAVRDSIEATFANLRWREVHCIERNGVIRNYIVRYGPEGGEKQNATTPGEMRRFTVDGLSPSTEYTFEVAAVNSAGIGPFTPPLILTTFVEAPPGPVVRVVVFVDTAAMTIAWDQPDPPNGVIQYYDIVYCDELRSILVNVSHGVRDPLDRFLSRVNRDTSKVLTVLKPDTRYNITITPYNTHQGNLTSFTAKTLSIPRVSGFRAVIAVNSTAVGVSWFAVEIAHVPEVYYELCHHVSSSSSDKWCKFINSGNTSAVVDFGSPIVAQLEHTFSVAAAYKTEGTEFVGEFSDFSQLSYNVMICDSGDERSSG